MYYTVCYLTDIFYAAVRQISMLFHRQSNFCILYQRGKLFLAYLGKVQMSERVTLFTLVYILVFAYNLFGSMCLCVIERDRD